MLGNSMCLNKLILLYAALTQMVGTIVWWYFQPPKCKLNQVNRTWKINKYNQKIRSKIIRAVTHRTSGQHVPFDALKKVNYMTSTISVTKKWEQFRSGCMRAPKLKIIQYCNTTNCIYGLDFCFLYSVNIP